VEQMRAAVFQETKLTCSAGIAPNKVLGHHALRLTFGQSVTPLSRTDASKSRVTLRFTAKAVLILGPKICSDKNKPNGQYYLPPEREKIFNFMQTLPVRKVSFTVIREANRSGCSALGPWSWQSLRASFRVDGYPGIA
jgi:nucleotidyltransferase/DNA polymerase involved in DNA repair